MRTFLALLLLALTACNVVQIAPSPPASAGVAIGPATQRELEGVLQKKADAVRRQDLNAYQSTIDLTRAPLRRCSLEAFDQASRGSIPFGTLGTRILKIEPYLDTYVRAYVEDDGNAVSRRYFRREGGTWLLTEPREEELGGEKKKVVEGVEISYWGVDDDISDVLANEALATRTFLQRLERTPARSAFALRFYPTRSAVGSIVGCRNAGSATLLPNDPYLRIYFLWLDRSLHEVSADSRAIIRHEGLHWLQDQFVDGIAGRMDWWLTEGWPDYVGGYARPSTGPLICGGKTPALRELQRGAPVDDPTTPTELASQYYSYAHSMVEYLYTRFGADAYWNFMSAYKSTMNADAVYANVLQQSPDAFYADWLAWARNKYC